MLGDQVIRWLPTLCVVLFVALALTSTGSTSRRKRSWFAVIILAGSLAIAATVWQQRTFREEAAGLLARRDRAAARVAALSREAKALRSKIANLERSEKGRVISEKTAAKLVADLRQSGGREVVVSCIWGDDEAYDYANQIADLLKEAGWRATGPEPTVIFGNAPSMAIGVYVPEEAAPDTAKILMDAFTKSAIPYETRVPPSGVLPAGSAVELFISRKPESAVGEGSTTQ